MTSIASSDVSRRRARGHCVSHGRVSVGGVDAVDWAGKADGAWVMPPPMPRPVRDDLEGQPHARGRVVTVMLITLHWNAVQKLRHFQRRTCRQVVTGEVECRVRSEAPGEPTVDLSTDVAGITRDKALVAHRDSGRAPGRARRDVEGRTPRIRVYLLCRTRRGDNSVEAKGWRDAVRRTAGGLHALVARVADVGVHTLVRPAAAVEVVDAEAEDPEPATAPVAGVEVEWLVVPLAQGQVVPGLVTGAVHSAALEEQRAQLEAADDVEEPGRGVAPDLPDRSVGSERLGVVLTPLIGDRGIQAEGAHAPARVETDGVPVFMIRRVAGRGGAQGRAPPVVYWFDHQSQTRCSSSRRTRRAACRRRCGCWLRCAGRRRPSCRRRASTSTSASRPAP